MSFNRLLFAAVSSQKYIQGEGKRDKVHISPPSDSRDGYSGEVVLCFQLDGVDDDRRKLISSCLGIREGDKRCDGLVYYTQDEKEEKVICLVEMKSSGVEGADQQLISTKKHILTILYAECEKVFTDSCPECKKYISHIKWKACLYHHCSSPTKLDEVERQLKGQFVETAILDSQNNDLRPLLSGQKLTAKELAKKFKASKRR